MMTYYTIHFRSRDMDTVTLTEAAFRAVEPAIMAREDTLLKAGSVTFNARDVRYAKKVVRQDYPAMSAAPPISEEKREANLRRLAVMREIFFSGKRLQRTLDEEWINPYTDPNPLARMSRAELRAFHKEFFDVRFASQGHQWRTAARWLEFERGDRDPRDYDRDTIIAQAAPAEVDVAQDGAAA